MHVNYFQPSFKLLEKLRDGAKVIKRYSPPARPCDRVMQDDTIPAWMKEQVREYRAGLDPVALLRSITEAQSAMATMSATQPLGTSAGESIDRFLIRLPSLWQEDETGSAHKARAHPPQHWRTRKDPFEGVWCELPLWVERDLDTTAKNLMARLSASDPERLSDGSSEPSSAGRKPGAG